jgi:hypothetical protein
MDTMDYPNIDSHHIRSVTVQERDLQEGYPYSTCKEGLDNWHFGESTVWCDAKVSLTATCIRPLHMLATEPVVLPLSIYQFLVVANLYTLNAAVPYIFLAIYRFNSGEQGLAYISFGIGFTLGLAILICVAQHKIRKARAASAKGVRVKASAEARLQPTRMGGLVPPLGIFWCGGSLASPCSLDWPNGRNGCLSPGRWI